MYIYMYTYIYMYIYIYIYIYIYHSYKILKHKRAKIALVLDLTDRR